jgi:hypothetical protein
MSAGNVLPSPYTNGAPHVILDRAAIGDLSSAVAVPDGTATAEERSPLREDDEVAWCGGKVR